MISFKRRQAVIADRRAGMKITDIVKKHGMSRSTVGRICVTGDVRVQAPDLTAEQFAIVAEMYLNGSTQLEIAKRFNRTAASISLAMKRNGMKARRRTLKPIVAIALLRAHGVLWSTLEERFGVGANSMSVALRARGVIPADLLDLKPAELERYAKAVDVLMMKHPQAMEIARGA